MELWNKFVKGVKTHAPEIKTTFAVLGLGTTGVLSFMAGGKVKDILSETDAKLKDVEEHLKAEFISLEESEKMKKDIRKKEAVQITKAVAPAVCTAILTAGVTIENTVSMKRVIKGLETDLTNVTASAIAAGSMLKKYRERVRADQGEEKDIEYMYGAKHTEVETVDENGEIVKKKVMTLTQEEVDEIKNNPKDYSFILDASWDEWTPNDLANLNNIGLIERDLNDQFQNNHDHPWVLYNDILRAFHKTLTSFGFTDGKIYDPDDPDCDNYIKLNVYTFSLEKEAGLVDPRELMYLITPNIDGPIIDKLRKRGLIGE